MRIEFQHISMSFGANMVLKDVSFSAQGGQILALLGENGAGKSTLMGILGGLFPPVSGHLLIDGEPVSFRTPRDSISAGIAFIHQELNPVNDLKVYENLFLGQELRNAVGILRRSEMLAEAEKLFSSIGVNINANACMRQLDASGKQLVEIARALRSKAQVIIMDEPTASLSEGEIQLLFGVARRLQEQGVLIVFISHKLNEVMELCSHYVVLRNGELVAQGRVDEVKADELPPLIVGRELAAMLPKENILPGAEILCAENFGCEPYFRSIDFSVHANEVLGFTGLLGDGRSELFRCIFGDIRNTEGRLYFKGKPYQAAHPEQALRQGIAYVPSNRKENAILPDLSILANGTLATLKRYCRHGFLQKKLQQAAFCREDGALHIKYGSLDDAITTLSGGNQQKVILARWLEAAPEMLILDNPTQGVDIGAKQEIYDGIRRIAASGVAVIVLSGEAQEICRICSRCIVMCHGSMACELQQEQITEENIMHYAMGLQKEEQL